MRQQLHYTFICMNSRRAQLVKLILILVIPILQQVSIIQKFSKTQLNPSGDLTSFQGFANSSILLNAVTMFSQETPELCFKVLETFFEEQRIFSVLTHSRCTLIKQKPLHLEVVAERLHVDHPQPYSKMKKLLIQISVLLMKNDTLQ